MKKHLYLNVFSKHLLSYVTILIVPILFLFVFVYNSVIVNLTNEVTDKNLNMLTQAKNTIDEQMNSLSKISQMIEQDPALTRMGINQDVTSLRNATTILKNYVAIHSILHEIVLYHHGEEYLYTSSGTYTPKSFTSYAYMYGNWTAEQFLRDLTTATTIKIRPAEEVFSSQQTTRFVTCIIPFPLASSTKSGAVLYMIEESKLSRVLEDLIRDTHGQAFILDGEGRIITASHRSEIVSSDELTGIIPTLKNGLTEKIPFADTEYLASYMESEVLNWSYITLLPSQDVTKSLRNVEKNAIYGTLFIFIFGCIVIYGAMRLNYSPVRNLRRYTEVLTGRDLSKTGTIDEIRTTIEHFYTNVHSLKDKVKDNRYALKEILLLDLIKGHFDDIQEFNLKGIDIGLSFTKRFFAVAVMAMENLAQLSDISDVDIINYIEKDADLELYGKKSTTENTVILILSVDECDTALMENYFLSLRSKLHNELSLDVTIGIGSIYKELRKIGKSFIEASSALDYRFVKGKYSIIFYSEIDTFESSDYLYLIEEIHQMNYFLTERKPEQAIQIFDLIIDKILQHNYPLFTVRSLCFDIISVVIKVVNRIYSDYPGSFEKQDLDVLSLMTFNTVEELAHTIKGIFLDICRYIEQRGGAQHDKRICEIIEYIQQNFCEYQFSVQSMADHFKMSAPSLGNYFKSQTGQNITDYLNSLKIEHAKKLLITTDLNIDDIVIKMGYTNTSSFIRKFRQATGITPGNFRKMHLLMKKDSDESTD